MTNPATEIDLLMEINKKLDKLIAVMAVQGKSTDEQVKILRGMNFTYEETSKLTGIPEGTLKSREHNKRKKQ